MVTFKSIHAIVIVLRVACLSTSLVVASMSLSTVHRAGFLDINLVTSNCVIIICSQGWVAGYQFSCC